MEYDSNYIEEAEKIFAKLLDSNYQKDKVMYYLASLYYKDSSIYHFSAKINIQEICKLIENAIELNNNDSEYWYLLGGINLYTNRDYNKALYYYKKAYKINHSEIIKNHKEKYYYTFGKVNLYLGNYDAAIEIFKKTIKDFRESEYFKYSISRREEANYIHYLGLSYEKNEQYDEAIKSYEKSWHIYQDSCIDIECYRYHRQHIIKSIYDLYKKVGKNREAIQFLKASILYDISYPLKIIPLDIEEKDFKGSEAYNDIVQAYTLRIEERSFYGIQYIMPCREKLADFYKTYKEYDKAEELYKIISRESYKNIARMYAEDENYDKAIDTYKTIIQIYPDDSSCYSDIAYIYEEIKNYEEAINYYNKSFEKGNLSCSRRIAEFYENINEYSKAIYFYTKYIDFSKNDFYVLKNIANLYNKLNDIENRNLYYEKIADILKEFIQNDVYDEYDI
ncbi:tetratricopeptide repeat protein, partial [Brachyspira catarrhinii]